MSTSDQIANAGWQQGIVNRKAAADFWSPNGGIILFSYRYYGKVIKFRRDSCHVKREVKGTLVRRSVSKVMRLRFCYGIIPQRIIMAVSEAKSAVS
jgi:hypothetical protein